ncbi:MAG: DnaA regulatory inactivator Hda [Propionivibrio sp.]
MRQLLLDLLPETPPSLDNFVAGCNAEALAGLTVWLSPDSREASLLLWGEGGAGKTHLLRASGAAYQDALADPDLGAIDADLLADDPEKLRFRAVDNVEALSAAGQIALFNLYNRIRAAGGRLLTAAALPPMQLALREDLRTRLGQGLIYRIHALTDEQMIAALRAYAGARRLRLSPEAFDYLFARAPRDMRSLMGLLSALDRYSLEHKRAITLPLLREVLMAPVEIQSS